MLEGEIDAAAVARLVASFHRRHQEVYGQSDPEAPVEIVSLRTVHWFPVANPELPGPATTKSWDEAKKGSRIARFFPEFAEGVDTPVYDRLKAPLGVPLAGPAIIDQLDTTTVVYPGFVCEVDPSGSMIMTATDNDGHVAPSASLAQELAL